MKNKIVSLLLPLFIYSQVYLPAPKKSRTYYLKEKPVNVQVQNFENSLELKIDYENPKTFTNAENWAERIRWKYISLRESCESSKIFVFLPKSVKIKSVEQEVEMYDVYEKKIINRKVSQTEFDTLMSNTLERLLKRIALEAISSTIPLGDVAVKIIEYHEKKSKEEEKKFLEKLAEEKYCLAKICLIGNYSHSLYSEYPISRKIRINLDTSFLKEVYGRSAKFAKGQGIIYYVLDFGISPVGEAGEIKDTMSFFFDIQ
jgi:hypothetical protein